MDNRATGERTISPKKKKNGIKKRTPVIDNSNSLPNIDSLFNIQSLGEEFESLRLNLIHLFFCDAIKHSLIDFDFKTNLNFNNFKTENTLSEYQNFLNTIKESDYKNDPEILSYCKSNNIINYSIDPDSANTQVDKMKHVQHYFNLLRIIYRKKELKEKISEEFKNQYENLIFNLYQHISPQLNDDKNILIGITERGKYILDMRKMINIVHSKLTLINKRIVENLIDKRDLSLQLQQAFEFPQQNEKIELLLLFTNGIPSESRLFRTQAHSNVFAYKNDHLTIDFERLLKMLKLTIEIQFDLYEQLNDLKKNATLNSLKKETKILELKNLNKITSRYLNPLEQSYDQMMKDHSQTQVEELTKKISSEKNDKLKEIATAKNDAESNITKLSNEINNLIDSYNEISKEIQHSLEGQNNNFSPAFQQIQKIDRIQYSDKYETALQNFNKSISELKATIEDKISTLNEISQTIKLKTLEIKSIKIKFKTEIKRLSLLNFKPSPSPYNNEFANKIERAKTGLTQSLPSFFSEQNNQPLPDTADPKTTPEEMIKTLKLQIEKIEQINHEGKTRKILVNQLEQIQTSYTEQLNKISADIEKNNQEEMSANEKINQIKVVTISQLKKFGEHRGIIPEGPEFIEIAKNQKQENKALRRAKKTAIKKIAAMKCASLTYVKFTQSLKTLNSHLQNVSKEFDTFKKKQVEDREIAEELLAKQRKSEFGHKVTDVFNGVQHIFDDGTKATLGILFKKNHTDGDGTSSNSEQNNNNHASDTDSSSEQSDSDNENEILQNQDDGNANIPNIVPNLLNEDDEIGKLKKEIGDFIGKEIERIDTSINSPFNFFMSKNKTKIKKTFLNDSINSLSKDNTKDEVSDHLNTMLNTKQITQCRNIFNPFSLFGGSTTKNHLKTFMIEHHLPIKNPKI